MAKIAIFHDEESGLVYARNRYLNPTLGKWMTREPFGSAYIDGMDLYQTEGSAPNEWLDPGGTKTILVNIFVDKKNKPNNFNSKAIEKLLNQMLSACKCKNASDSFQIRVTEADKKPVIVTDSAGVDLEPDLGIIWDRPGGIYNNGNWDLVPFVGWVRKPYRAIAKEPIGWESWLTFVNTQFPLGATKGGLSQVSPSGIQQGAQNALSGQAIDWNQTWANMVAHEVLSQGVADDRDDTNNLGNIDSGTQPAVPQRTNGLDAVPASWCKDFLSRLGLK